jgi:hypothetical protein
MPTSDYQCSGADIVITGTSMPGVGPFEYDAGIWNVPTLHNDYVIWVVGNKNGEQVHLRLGAKVATMTFAITQGISCTAFLADTFQSVYLIVSQNSNPTAVLGSLSTSPFNGFISSTDFTTSSLTEPGSPWENQLYDLLNANDSEALFDYFVATVANPAVLSNRNWESENGKVPSLIQLRN